MRLPAEIPTPMPIVERKNAVMMPTLAPNHPPSALPTTEPTILKSLLISRAPGRGQVGPLTELKDLAALHAGEASGMRPEVVRLRELGVLAGSIPPCLAQLLRAL